jgi:phosphotransferase system enzyme I (PtsI)
MSPQAVSLKLHAIAASPGMAIGRAFVLDRRRVRTPKLKLAASEVEAELMRFKTAIDLSEHQLQGLKDRLERSDGKDHALILEAHRLMLRDPMLFEEVNRLIAAENINAEWAVRRVTRKIKHLFDEIPDEYFRERRADVDFIADRVVRNLLGQVVDVEEEVPEGSIIVAHDLSPADAAMLARTGRVAAFVTDVGGSTSHTAIVARARSTPAVVGAGRVSEQICPGDVVAVDGDRGVLWINPPSNTLDEVRADLEKLLARGREEMQLAELPAITTDGFRVRLQGNMEFLEEIPQLLASGAEGIGLYRTEFLFLDRLEAPTEQEHYLAYRSVLEKLGGRPVTIRTVDLGGDKMPGFRKSEREPNPAMGLRAIRYSLNQREMFRAQLRALLRASVHGNLRVMFPLISGVAELREARTELEHCRAELSREGVRMSGRFPVGIMIETPSAAWIADRLAQEADFFSIGTNDLIQYTLAIDRQNRDVAYLYKPLHLSVLRTLLQIADSAKRANLPVSMCGEMAGDPRFTLILLALGLDELSMPAGQIPRIKQLIRRVSRAEAVAALDEALRLTTAEEIDRHFRATEARLGLSHD